MRGTGFWEVSEAGFTGFRDLQDWGTCDESHYYERDGDVVEMPGKDKESILLCDLYPFLRFCVNKKQIDFLWELLYPIKIPCWGALLGPV